VERVITRSKILGEDDGMKAAVQQQRSPALPEPVPRKSILLVEPEPESQLLLKMLLAEEGYEVVVCSTSTVALGIAGISKLDLVVTAHSHPEIDGLSLLKAIRQRHADIPVIVISARNEQDTQVAALELGALGCFTKPLDCAAIRKSIRDQSHTTT
jgi:DNA-binding response OmpR family regulator